MQKINHYKFVTKQSKIMWI